VVPFSLIYGFAIESESLDFHVKIRTVEVLSRMLFQLRTGLPELITEVGKDTGSEILC
jgi:hypothetical protein